jgi:hypothetical protein
VTWPGGLSFRVIEVGRRAGQPQWGSIDPACRWPRAKGPQSEGPERRRSHLRFWTVTPGDGT